MCEGYFRKKEKSPVQSQPGSSSACVMCMGLISKRRQEKKRDQQVGAGLGKISQDTVENFLEILRPGEATEVLGRTVR